MISTTRQSDAAAFWTPGLGFAVNLLTAPSAPSSYRPGNCVIMTMSPVRNVISKLVALRGTNGLILEEIVSWTREASVGLSDEGSVGP